MVKAGRLSSAPFLITTARGELAKPTLLLDACMLDFSKHRSVLRKLCQAFYDHVAKHVRRRLSVSWRPGKRDSQVITDHEVARILRLLFLGSLRAADDSCGYSWEIPLSCPARETLAGKSLRAIADRMRAGLAGKNRPYPLTIVHKYGYLRLRASSYARIVLWQFDFVCCDRGRNREPAPVCRRRSGYGRGVCSLARR